MPVATAPRVSSRAVGEEPRTLYSALALYFLVVLIGFPFFRHLIGPDLISYISIARHYAAGDWGDAINTYWSPLTSWFIAPLLILGVPGMVALKIVTLAGGVLALFATVRLARGFELSPGVETVVVCTAALMIAAYSLVGSGPDVWAAAITLFYLKLVFDCKEQFSLRLAVLCGLLGGLGFYTKAYLFCFFLVHFTAMAALRSVHLHGLSRKKIWLHYLAGLGAFFIVCTPWLLAMRAKTGEFTLGTTSAWNDRMVGPQSPGYIQYYGLIAPPNGNAISMWEAPSPNLLPNWHPLSSFPALKYEVRLLFQNLKWLRTFLLETSLLSFAIVFAYFIWGLAQGAAARYWWPLVFATLLILPSGYLLITIEDRYIWSCFLLLLLIGAVVIDAVTRHSTRRVRTIALAGYVLSFILFPIHQLVVERNGGKSLFMASSALHGVIPAQSRLAACGSWNDSLAIAYYLHLRFYGSTAATSAEEATRIALGPITSADIVPSAPSPSQIARSLQKNQISYYLVWPACRVLPPDGLLTAPIALPGLPGAKIFQVASTGHSER